MEKLKLETVQWDTIPHIDDVEPMSEYDYDVLKEVGEVLKKHGKKNKFGVCLLHKHFDLKKGEKMFEITDVENKQLISRVSSNEEEINGNVIETQWRFPKGIESVTVCEQVCHFFLGHKPKHKKVGR